MTAAREIDLLASQRKTSRVLIINATAYNLVRLVRLTSVPTSA
jgi:hypothetical protein